MPWNLSLVRRVPGEVKSGSSEILALLELLLHSQANSLDVFSQSHGFSLQTNRNKSCTSDVSDALAFSGQTDELAHSRVVPAGKWRVQ